MVFVQDKNVYTEYTLDDMNIVNEFIKETISKLDNVSNNELKDNMYDTNKLMNSQIVFLNTIEYFNKAFNRSSFDECVDEDPLSAIGRLYYRKK